MADTKTSDLTAIPALDGADVLPIVDATDTLSKKVSVTQLDARFAPTQPVPMVEGNANHNHTLPGIVRTGRITSPTLQTGRTHYFGPYFLWEAATFNALIWEVSTIVGTVNVRLAIIEADDTYQVGSIVEDLGVTAVTGTGTKTNTFTARSFAAGSYFVGIRAEADLVLTTSTGCGLTGHRGTEASWRGTGHYGVAAEAYGAWATPPTNWDQILSTLDSGRNQMYPFCWRVPT